MFQFKQCQKCKTKNNKHHNHCAKCGNILGNALKTGTKSLVIIIGLFLMLSGSASYAYFKYYKKPVPQTGISTVKNDTGKTVVPWNCPTGTKSPTGGNINWDGSTVCVPEDTPSTTTTPNATTSAPKSATPAPQSPPSTTTPSPTPDTCSADLAAAVQSYQDDWDYHYAVALAELNRRLDELLATYTAQGLENSSFYLSAKLATTKPFDEQMERDFAEYQRQLTSATVNYQCGQATLTP
jgi:hypothetical protein